jgi:hypothetical protein
MEGTLNSTKPAPGVGGDWNLHQTGAILVMPYNNGAFGMAETVVPSVYQNTYNFYPTWSPDSKWIVFATTDFPGMSNTISPVDQSASYDQADARLRMVRATGGTPIELLQATHQMNRTSTWPKFAPFVQDSGNLVFITFNSRFAYGFVVPDRSVPQLWMSAIDLSVAAVGADPSYSPFWLPFQDSTSGNHSAIWTEQVVCTVPTDCPTGFTCTNNMCVQIVQ